MPIGRFSKITRLSIKALRNYDEQDLLHPAWVDPGSGYRYYRLSQARKAEAIRILRSLDMPIAEIQDVLAADAPDVARKYLARHRERLEGRLQDHRRMLAFLERLIEREEGVMPYEVVVKDLPSTPVLAVRETVRFEELGVRIGEGMQRLMAHISGSGVEMAGPPMVVYHGDIVEEGRGQIDICVPTRGAAGEQSDILVTEIPGGAVASTLHRGPYDEIQPAYHALAGWIQEHGHEVAGPPREIYLNDPSQAEPADLETEVVWPIR
jgi:effector-binding domain-containing protein